MHIFNQFNHHPFIQIMTAFLTATNNSSKPVQLFLRVVIQIFKAMLKIHYQLTKTSTLQCAWIK